MADEQKCGAEEKIGHLGRDGSASKSKNKQPNSAAASTPPRAGRNGCAAGNG